MVNQSLSAALTHHSSFHIHTPYQSLRATSVPGPKGLRGRRPHSNCVSSNRVQQLSQSVCVGVTLSLGWLVVRGRRPHSIRVRHSNRVRHAYRPEGPQGPKATFELRVLEPRATIVTKCMCRCDIIPFKLQSSPKCLHDISNPNIYIPIKHTP